MDTGGSTALNSSSVSLDSTNTAGEDASISLPPSDRKVGETSADGGAKSPERSDSDKVPGGEQDAKEMSTDDNDKKKTKARPKPRVIRETMKGIWTIKHYESANFAVEWYKGLRASMPYLLRLSKTYWGLSNPLSIGIVAASIGKIALPSAELYVQKELLDGVQNAIEGKAARPRRMLALLALRLLTTTLYQGLDLVTDKIDAIMERRMSRVLDVQLVEAYLRLDIDQVVSKKVMKQFDNAKRFVNASPTGLIVQFIDLIRIILTIATSTFALSRLLSRKGSTLLVLSAVQMTANLYRLFSYMTQSIVCKPTNVAWHRLNLIKGFAINDDLRRDITVTGIAPWLTSEMTEANDELGDMSTRPPWQRRASSWRSFMFNLGGELMNSFEYIWLAFRGIKLGASLGNLHLLRDSTHEVYRMAWELSLTAEQSTSNWKNLIAFYNCLEVKPHMSVPTEPTEYVSQPGGMKIEARSIRYKYDVEKEAEVLTGASFVINPGEMVAVVGFNGAGKSTLAKLLARLANVTGGELLINDVNVSNYDPAVLRNNIGALFQDIGKYNGLTILENIGLGKVSALHSKESIEKSAEDAGASDFIEKLPYKYDSYLGLKPGETVWGHSTGRWDESDSDSDDDDKPEKERVQKNLSGGQWQKIALARAFMRGTEADLLVLDEPTANLDPEAEYKLFETIKKIRNGKTTVYISHRFNTVRAADKIMVMEKGGVVEFGSHEELMALKDGTYRRLYTLQAKGFQSDDTGRVSKDVEGLVVAVKEDTVKKIVAEGA